LVWREDRWVLRRGKELAVCRLEGVFLLIVFTDFNNEIA
jgi:hypothetical protein